MCSAGRAIGTTVAAQYAKLGINLRVANTDRVNGWAEILGRLGDPGADITPRLFIHRRCGDADEDGVGGDDAADCLRYLVATKGRSITQRKLRGV
jgi:hypothetical protein